MCAPEEGIYLAMLATLRPGDRVVATFPGYQSLQEVARSLGCSVALWELERWAAAQGQAALGRARAVSLLLAKLA